MNQKEESPQLKLVYSKTRFDGETYEPEKDKERLSGQIQRVWRAILPGAWMTLDEIARITGDQHQSISARLRDLRKDRFGGWTIERRRRGDPKAGLFEYKLDREKWNAVKGGHHEHLLRDGGPPGAPREIP